MTGPSRDLYAWAAGYARTGLAGVTPLLLDRPTPCRGWCLRELAEHVTDSLATLDAAVAAGGPLPLGDRELPAGTVAVAGALELAVHGWDLAVACGDPRPVPAGPAAVLLPLAPYLVPPGVRPGLFADPVALPGGAAPGDRLVAFLGRRPTTPAYAPGLYP